MGSLWSADDLRSESRRKSDIVSKFFNCNDYVSEEEKADMVRFIKTGNSVPDDFFSEILSRVKKA